MSAATVFFLEGMDIWTGVSYGFDISTGGNGHRIKARCLEISMEG